LAAGVLAQTLDRRCVAVAYRRVVFAPHEGLAPGDGSRYLEGGFALELRRDGQARTTKDVEID
jgi:hypothetical protein